MKNLELARRDLLKQLGLGLACLPALNFSRAWAQGTGPSKKLMIILASEGGLSLSRATHMPPS